MRYLKEQVNAGWSIGELSKVGRDELVNRAQAAVPERSFLDNTFSRLVEEMLNCLEPFDRATFEKRLNGAVAVVPFEEALHGILLPLQERVGLLWHDGHVNIAIEHYVTKQIQQKIFSALNQLPVADFGPKVVIACPPGEDHDIAAVSVAYRCRVRGCRTHYLGANVPIPSLATFCSTVKPDLTLISIPLVLSPNEAITLVGALVNQVAPVSDLAAGGHGAEAMRELLLDSHIEVLENFSALDEKLNRLIRKPTAHS